MRPAVLITDAYNALNNQPYRRQKDKEFGGTWNPARASISCLILHPLLVAKKRILKTFVKDAWSFLPRVFDESYHFD